MNNYYELLNLTSDASGTEIETRLDDQYTKWRTLVTHHDANVVSQANQALKTLEEIRGTLMDADKRRMYDRMLAQERESIGGLADPDVILAQNPVMAPPRPRSVASTAVQQGEVERTDAWICTNPTCKKANQIGTQFCAKCGTRIGFECPNCGVLVELANKFCSSCGVNKEEHFKKIQGKKVAELQRELESIREEVQDGETDHKKILRMHPEIIKRAEINGRVPSIIGVMIILSSCLLILNDNIPLGVLLVVALLAVILVITRRRVTRGVEDYINDHLRPQLDSIEQEINRVKGEKYG